MYTGKFVQALESHVPEKGWGYTVMVRNDCRTQSTESGLYRDKYEVTPFFDGQLAFDMGLSITMCSNLIEVGRVIEYIMGDGNEEE